MAGAYDMAVAAADIAGAVIATLNEAISPADHSDDTGTICTATDLTLYTQLTPAATYVPGKHTKRIKRYIRGEAEQEPPTTETPKSSKAPNNPSAELTQNKMHQPVMETQWKHSSHIGLFKKNAEKRESNRA